MNDVHVDDREPEIVEAYLGLSTPVSPPEDLLARIDRGIRRRRNVRRGVAGVAALAVVGGVGVSVLGGDDGRQVAEDPRDSSTLTYTDTDSSTFTFEAEDIDVACNKDGSRMYLLRNNHADAVRAGRSPLDVPEDQWVLPVLYVELRLDEIDPPKTYNLPFEGQPHQEIRGMAFFFTAGTELEGSNELSSAQPDSSGRVILHEATCGPNPSLWIEIDAVLGSEEEMAPLAIKGEYRS